MFSCAKDEMILTPAANAASGNGAFPGRTESTAFMPARASQSERVLRGGRIRSRGAEEMRAAMAARSMVHGGGRPRGPVTRGTGVWRSCSCTMAVRCDSARPGPARRYRKTAAAIASATEPAVMKQ